MSILIKKSFFHSKKRLLKIISIISGIILSLFSGCREPAGVMYGSPYADYKFNGKVTSQATGNPIKGVEVTVLDINDSYNSDTAITDDNGNYSIKFTGYSTDDTIKMSIKDIDSVENGLFIDSDTLINHSKSDFIDNDDNSWSMGTSEKTIDIKLDTDE